MKIQDIPQVLKIEQVSFPTPWGFQAFLWELKKNGSVCLIAKDGKKITGYIMSSAILGYGHISNIAVHPDYRRRGIGKILLEECLSRLREKAEEVSLEVRKSNYPAISLYRKFGFREIGIRRRYYIDGEDAVIMSLKLNDFHR